MFRTFNMGIGLILVCAESDQGAVLEALERSAEKSVRLGRIVTGSREVRYGHLP